MDIIPVAPISENRLLNFKCINVDYSVLALPMTGIRLYGVFDFQVLFGVVEINRYIYEGKKYNEKNFIHASIPDYQLPLFVNIAGTVKDTDCNSFAVLTSRLRDLVDTSVEIASEILAMGSAIGVILLRHRMDYASSFIVQQHSHNIFRLPKNLTAAWMAERCFCVTSSLIESAYAYSTQECTIIRTIVERIYSERSTKQNGKSRLLLIGNKGVGKSTLMRFLVNTVLSMASNKVFLLDCDVGQAELTPSGLISLCELSEPFFSAPFAIQKLTFDYSFFFGGNSPSVDFGLYIDLVKRCLMHYESIKTDDSILFINTVGWIEALGHDLMCHLIDAVQPTILVNLLSEMMNNFQLPVNFRDIACNFKRQIHSGDSANTFYKQTSATLRSFLTAGYLASCLSKRPNATTSDELRFADVRPYRVPFGTVALYFQHDLAPVADSMVFAALNCAVVALCNIESIDEYFDRRRIRDDPTMPERITVRRKSVQKNRNSAKETRQEDPLRENILNEHRTTMMPILRCYGYGMIRAVDLEKRIFYVITPVDTTMLNLANVFAFGYELQTPDILFDQRSVQSAPYFVTLAQTFSRNHEKLFSPLRNVSGMRRAPFAAERAANTMYRDAPQVKRWK